MEKPSQKSAFGDFLDHAGGRPAGVTKLPGETLLGLQNSIKLIEKHFGQAEVAGSTLTADVLGNDTKNKDIAVLVRGQLCTALSRVLLLLVLML